MGGTLTFTAVGVTNGLFTATLDFGPGVFTGANLWLDISVGTNGSGTLSELAPRQPLTPTPYALYSPNAGNAATAATAATVGLNSVTPAQLNTAGSPASGQVLAYNGSGLVWITPPAGSSSSGWSLTGNSGTTPGVDFLGTTDNQPLDFWANNARGLRLEYASSSSRLALSSWTSVNVIGGYGANSVADGSVGGTIAGGGQHYFGGLGGSGDSPNSVTASFGTVGGGYGNTAGPDATVPGGYNNLATGDGSFAAGRNAQTTNSGSFVWSDGSQTATSSGVNCFDVWAAGGVFFHTGSAGVNVDNLTINGNLNLPANATLSAGGVELKANTLFLAATTSGEDALSYVTSGLNGVDQGTGPFLSGYYGGALGTINPGGRTTDQVALSWNWNGDVWVSNSLSTASLNIDENGANSGVVNPNALTFGINSGEGIASKRTAKTFDLEFFTDGINRMTVANNGNVGINATTPTETLEINGTSRIDDHDMYLRTGTDHNHGLGYRDIINGATIDGPFLYGWSGGALGTPSPDSIALSWDRNGNAWVNHNLSTATLTIRGGADVAEPFPVTGGQVEPGTVMVIDEANPGRLSRSARAYDTRVAGIISGAGGVKPGLELQQEGVLDHGQKVALSGRVYVRAEASRGAIRPGDLLTTSEVPGCAMKVSDHARAQGAILGKAMSGLSDGRGLVLVLVTLQ